jgi:hypothetical protein
MLRFEKRHCRRFRYAEILGKVSRYISLHLVHIFDVRISYISWGSLTIMALMLNKASDLKL